MGCRGRAQSWTLQFLDTRATRASHLQAEVTNEIRLQGDIIYLRCPFYEMQNDGHLYNYLIAEFFKKVS